MLAKQSGAFAAQLARLLSRARLYLWSPIDQHFIFLS